MSTHTNRLLRHDPRSMAKARLDYLKSQQITDERAPDRQFGVVGGMVIAAALSALLWPGLWFLGGLAIGLVLP